MAKTPSTMVPLGTAAPLFALQDVSSGKTVQLEQANGSMATVICFICNHCPFVKHIASCLASVAHIWQPHGVTWIAINSNDIGQYPDDSPENMRMMAEQYGFGFPYLFDETQEVAKAYAAACTPDFFVYDKDRRLVYRGQFDDSRPGNGIPVTGESLTLALDALRANQPVPEGQKASLGCNIKWKTD